MDDPDEPIDLKAVRRNVDRESPTVIFFSQNDSLLLGEGFIIHSARLKSIAFPWSMPSAFYSRGTVSQNEDIVSTGNF